MLDLITYPLRAILSAPERLVAGSRSLSKLSLPARVAILSAVFLVLSVTIAIVAYFSSMSNTRPSWRVTFTPTFVTVLVVLVVVIPIVLYKALKLWLEGEISPFPDIDRAWKAGLAELERQGLDPHQVPLFLVLGTNSLLHENAVFDTARLGLSIKEMPPGPAALHWYAGPEAIFLVCSDTSRLSRLAANFSEDSDRPLSPLPVSVSQPAPDAIRGTIVLGSPEAAAALSAARAAAHNPPPVPLPSATPNIQGTMLFGAGAPIADGNQDPAVPNVKEKRVIKLDQQDAAMQDQRLEYVCRLVRRARQPYCPINGILTLLPYGMIYRSEPDSSEIHRAVSKDLGTIRSMLKVRCPVTAAVVGLEEERGFRELMRRVGSEKGAAAANRALVHGLKSAAIRTARSPGSPCLRGVRRRCLQPVQRARRAAKARQFPALRAALHDPQQSAKPLGQDPQAGLCQRLRSARAARRLAVRRLLLRRDGRG